MNSPVAVHNMTELGPPYTQQVPSDDLKRKHSPINMPEQNAWIFYVKENGAQSTRRISS